MKETNRNFESSGERECMKQLDMFTRLRSCVFQISKAVKNNATELKPTPAHTEMKCYEKKLHKV